MKSKYKILRFQSDSSWKDIKTISIQVAFREVFHNFAKSPHSNDLPSSSGVNIEDIDIY